jgi:hypothetical protein
MMRVADESDEQAMWRSLRQARILVTLVVVTCGAAVAFGSAAGAAQPPDGKVTRAAAATIAAEAEARASDTPAPSMGRTRTSTWS